MRMKSLWKMAAGLGLLAASGCVTVKEANDFQNVKVDGRQTPAAVVEVENSVWLLLNFIPLGSGDPSMPNKNACRWFRNTVSLETNMKVLHAKMDEMGVHEVANLTSRYADEKYLLFLLAHRTCHTSAVLVKPQNEMTGSKESESKK